jgi:pimeloyl-ACP methyl ester carboxylesterase
MNRTAFLAGAGGAFAMAAFPHAARGAQSDFDLTTPTGTIFGTLTLPAGAPPYPVVLIIAGSGPTDRNGNSGAALHSDAYKQLAEALAKAGTASVRYDKRGVAASFAAAPKEADLRFDTYVDDAVAWTNLLRSDKRFSAITIAGHSEGSLIGMIAAERAPVHAFVSLEGAGRPAPVVLREQLQPKLPPALYAQADAALSQLQAGQLVPDPPAELAALFRPSVQPYLISWFKYDPAVEIAKVRAPITIVQGTADIQVTMADAQALKRGAPAAKLVVVDGMNHVLKYYPDHSSPAAALKGYEDPTLPIDAKVVTAVESAAA